MISVAIMHTVYHQRSLVTTTKMQITNDVVLPHFRMPKKDEASSMWFYTNYKMNLRDKVGNEWAKYVDVLFCNKNSCLLNHRKINEVINFDAQKLSKYSKLIAKHKYSVLKQY